jgi:hypothetical protein
LLDFYFYEKKYGMWSGTKGSSQCRMLYTMSPMHKYSRLHLGSLCKKALL